MREIKETTYKGTRILVGGEKREMIGKMVAILLEEGYQEISIPIIQFQDTFRGKVGDNSKIMFNFEDRGGREVCLAPEYTAVIQKLATTTFKQDKDVKLFYIQECFRGEKPQEGRYRQFTQLGVEILNPSKPRMIEMIGLSAKLITDVGILPPKLDMDMGVTRGLDYYKDGKGFEITCNELGAQKQVCGGGEYEGGIGFAIGIDRLLLIDKK